MSSDLGRISALVARTLELLAHSIIGLDNMQDLNLIRQMVKESVS